MDNGILFFYFHVKLEKFIKQESIQIGFFSKKLQLLIYILDQCLLTFFALWSPY